MSSVNRYVHSRVPTTLHFYQLLFEIVFFLSELPVPRGLTFLEAIWLVIYAKKIFSCKFMCWKKVVPGHNQGTRVPTRQKFI